MGVAAECTFDFVVSCLHCINIYHPRTHPQFECGMCSPRYSLPSKSEVQLEAGLCGPLETLLGCVTELVVVRQAAGGAA